MRSTSPSRPRIFLVGYPRGYRLELAEAFREEGFEVSAHEDARLAAMAISFECPDAILTNWSLTPPLGTLELIERYSGLLPILILTGHNVLMDAVRALRAGAADYIRFPCHFPEILARVERAQAASPAKKELRLGDLTLDVTAAMARIGDLAFSMTDREAHILAALIRCPEHPVSREALMRVAGITEVQETIIESYIKQLRQRHPLLRRAIKTKYGQGYAFFLKGEDQPSG